MINKRASTEEAKERKRIHILSKARSAFENTTYDTLKMTDIAKAAELAKGTVFNYFKSKEYLFMVLYLETYEARLLSLVNHMRTYEPSYDNYINFTLDHFQKILDHHLIYIRLLRIKYNLLEQHLDKDLRLSAQKYEARILKNYIDSLHEYFGIEKETIAEILDFEEVLLVGFINISKNYNYIDGKEILNTKKSEKILEIFKGYLNGLEGD